MAFGGVWKDSLSELSGGQKSLLALSLILAMLLFKPAPIYILDEVRHGGLTGAARRGAQRCETSLGCSATIAGCWRRWTPRWT